MAKYIIVCGGVISGIGKGLSGAAIGYLLSLRNHKVIAIKMDGYYNTNAGVLAPREHGEVFLCEDGSETDLDLGHYERIIGIEVSKRNILTNGALNDEIKADEASGKYLGQTIQVVPHVTDKIQEKMLDLGKEADIVIVEIGGTVGDIEGQAYLEAARQFKQKHWQDVIVVLVAPILWIETIKEFKTKPLQQSVKSLQSFGLTPEILICRPLNVGIKEMPLTILDKIAHLTNVPRDAIFDAPDVKTIYQVPIEFYNRSIDAFIIDRFGLKRNLCRIQKYQGMVEKYIKNTELPTVQIGIVGKYDNCDEAYLSLKEALYHAGVSRDAKVSIRWISADELETAKDMRGVWKHFEGCDGIIVPGGFGDRGIEGKIRAVKYCREKKIPYLGICLGLQCAVIEVARSLANLADANSTEFSKNTTAPVIHFVEGQEGVKSKVGTMRLGAYDCELAKDSLVHDLYKKKLVSERHRHRYEVNSEYIPVLEKAGFKVSGVNPQSNLVEMMELDRAIHPYFVGTQAHPEFKSRLGAPAPLFDGLVAAALVNKVTTA